MLFVPMAGGYDAICIITGAYIFIFIINKLPILCPLLIIIT